MKNYLLPVLVILVACTSCKKEENKKQDAFGNRGMYIVNEGSFGAGNSSVSFLDFTNGDLINNIFYNANGYPLGDVAQSMVVHNNRGYIVVNNSAKVEVVNLDNFESVATISGLQGPRYMVITGGKGFISDWFSNTVAVVDLSSNNILGQIPAGNGPEQMLVDGNSLYVANVGGFGNDSTITIINTQTLAVVKTLNVGINPNSIKKDMNGTIWVLCHGTTGPDFTPGTADDIAGSAWKINSATLEITDHFTMNAAKHPVKLQIDPAGSTLYFLDGDNGYDGPIASVNINTAAWNPNIIVNRKFYGFGLDPSNNIIYGGSAPGFTQNGYMFRYTITGSVIDSMEVGIAPNYFAFR